MQSVTLHLYPSNRAVAEETMFEAVDVGSRLVLQQFLASTIDRLLLRSVTL